MQVRVLWPDIIDFRGLMDNTVNKRNPIYTFIYAHAKAAIFRRTIPALVHSYWRKLTWMALADGF